MRCQLCGRTNCGVCQTHIWSYKEQSPALHVEICSRFSLGTSLLRQNLFHFTPISGCTLKWYTAQANLQNKAKWKKQINFQSNLRLFRKTSHVNKNNLHLSFFFFLNLGKSRLNSVFFRACDTTRCLSRCACIFERLGRSTNMVANASFEVLKFSKRQYVSIISPSLFSRNPCGSTVAESLQMCEREKRLAKEEILEMGCLANVC